MSKEKNSSQITSSENSQSNNSRLLNFIYNSNHRLLRKDFTEKENNSEKKDKNEEQISFISLNDMSSLNDSKINQIVNLPKLSQEEVMKYISKIPIKEREDHNTRKILFCSLILTLTLKHFLNENKYNYNIRANNDLQQSLLTMAVQILNYK